MANKPKNCRVDGPKTSSGYCDKSRKVLSQKEKKRAISKKKEQKKNQKKKNLTQHAKDQGERRTDHLYREPTVIDEPKVRCESISEESEESLDMTIVNITYSRCITERSIITGEYETKTMKMPMFLYKAYRDQWGTSNFTDYNIKAVGASVYARHKKYYLNEGLSRSPKKDAAVTGQHFDVSSSVLNILRASQVSASSAKRSVKITTEPELPGLYPGRVTDYLAHRWSTFSTRLFESVDKALAPIDRAVHKLVTVVDDLKFINPKLNKDVREQYIVVERFDDNDFPSLEEKTIVFSEEDEVLEEIEDFEDTYSKEKSIFVEENRDMSIIPALGIVGIYCEEWCKSIGLVNIVGWLDDYVNKSNYRAAWHKATMRFDLSSRLKIHIAHNSGRHLTTVEDMYAYVGSDITIVKEITEIKRDSLPHKKSPKTSETMIMELKSKNKGSNIDNPRNIPMYITLGFVTPMSTVTLDFDCYLNSIVERSLNNPVYDVSSTQIGYMNAVIHYVFRNWKHPGVDDYDQRMFEENLNSDQKRKIARVISKLQEKPLRKWPTKVMLKLDEKQYGKEKLVPRLIYNVSPYYLYKWGAHFYSINKFLARMFNSSMTNPIYFENKVYYFYYPSGATSDELNRFVDRALTSVDAYYVLVYGDDTLIIDRYEFVIYENDYSGFDNTQLSRGVFQFFPTFLEVIGMTDLKDAYIAMYDEDILYSYNRGEISFNERNLKLDVGRMSGEGVTSCANTLTNIVSVLYHLSTGYGFENLGLKVKTKRVEYIDQATFLRGVFLQSEEGVSWTRLPSFLGKMGMFLNNPKSVVGANKSSRWKRNHHYDECAKMLLWANWLGYGKHFANNWFYRDLGIALGKVTNRRTNAAARRKMKLKEWQITSNDTRFVSDDVFNLFIKTRYNLEQHELQMIIDQVAKITKLPALIVCPAVSIFVETDY